jgi:hypothetical protein
MATGAIPSSGDSQKTAEADSQEAVAKARKDFELNRDTMAAIKECQDATKWFDAVNR